MMELLNNLITGANGFECNDGSSYYEAAAAVTMDGGGEPFSRYGIRYGIRYGERYASGIFELLLSQLSSSSGTLAEEALLPQADRILFAAAPALPPTVTIPGENRSPSAELSSDTGSSSAYDSLISAAALKYGVDAALIKGVIDQESSFKSDAVSKSGAKGLMQLMDGTARGLGVADSFDPVQNIDGGTRFLSYLLRKYDNNVSVALAAYNAGPGRVDRLGIAADDDIAAKFNTLPRETQDYIGKVLQAAERWRVQA
ncbi:lytic transglycosylase domain-containing protein [Cohnella kolymensis]|uniref:lytic transglycosylase domain-containing protein n=1 Tax=Cohnella kolymensis TaxID=1590652 RepID=UPI0006979CA7|nr:lytic transglycosylase domain-containing protein [Cohnella kolymensis]